MIVMSEVVGAAGVESTAKLKNVPLLFPKDIWLFMPAMAVSEAARLAVSISAVTWVEAASTLSVMKDALTPAALPRFAL